MGFYFELLPCTYAFIKGVVVNILSQNSLVPTVAFVLTIVCLVIGFLLIFPWFIFYLMVKMYLVLCERDKYGGFLSLNSVMEHTKMTITVVYILEHDGSFEQLLANVEVSCQNFMRSHYRFASTVRRCCGYYYFLKEQVTIDDVISVADEECSTKHDLVEYLRKDCFRLLDSGVKLWSVRVFRNPITWNGDNKSCYYPVVITYNHCLADGICLAVFQQKYLLEDMTRKRFENALGKSKTPQRNAVKSDVLQFPLVKAHLTLLSNSGNPDQNLGLFIEKEPKYLGLIRELSKRFQCTFTDLLLSASAVVLTDYMEQKNIFPRMVHVGNTCRIVTEDSSALLNGNIFDNEVSNDVYALPNVKCKSILETFLKLKEVLNIQRNTTISQFLYMSRKILSYLPAEVLLRVLGLPFQGVLLGITNIPGVDSARFGGAVVKDCFVLVNHCLGVKFIMTINSHGGRLQVSLISEKCLVTSKEDLQEVLGKVFKVIDDLSEQCVTT